MDDIPEEEIPAVDEAAHAVVREAKDAGVLLHAGGLDEDVEPVMAAGDGTVTAGTYPETKELNGPLVRPKTEVPPRLRTALDRVLDTAGKYRNAPGSWGTGKYS